MIRPVDAYGSVYPNLFEEVGVDREDEIMDLDPAVYETNCGQNNEENSTYFYPVCKKEVIVDEAEDLTIQLLAHFHSLADYIPRDDIEAATARAGDADVEETQNRRRQTSQSRLYRPFSRETETNFEQGISESSRLRNTTYKIFSILKNIFLGESQEDRIISEQRLGEDRLMWDKRIKRHYDPYFKSQVELVFTQATELLGTRQRYSKETLYHRVALSALLAISLFGHLKSRNSLTIFGLASSSLVATSLIVRYGVFCFDQAKRVNLLKLAIEKLEKEAAKHRINPAAIPSQTQKIF